MTSFFCKLKLALATTHQINRVAACAAELFAFSQVYMAQIVRNAQALGDVFPRRDIPMLSAHRGYTTTHQVIADVRQFSGGLEVAQRLSRANVITNKNLIPVDRAEDWDRPGGLYMRTIEFTCLGMGEAQMETIANFIACMLVEPVEPEAIRADVIAFRQPYQTLYYCFENALPA